MQTSDSTASINEPPAARRGDGLLLVTQHNTEKQLRIAGMNPALEGLLGFAKDEVLGRPLATILGAREIERLADDLTYDDADADFGDLFARAGQLTLRHRAGHELRIACTMSRLMSQGVNACFQIVFINQEEREAANKLSEFITLNFEGHKQLDPATGLVNLHTVQEFLPLLKNYYAPGEMRLVLALIRMDRHEKSIARYGVEAARQLLMHTYQICRSSFRAEDLIFVIAPHTLGLILFDIHYESARVVLNRLRWKIRNHRISFGGKADFSVSTSIGFEMLDMDAPSDTLNRCERAMQAADSDERNRLIELRAA